MEVKIITDVAEDDEPVSLVEAKAYLRIDADYYTDDLIIQSLIISARERLEKFTNLSFAPKTLEVNFNQGCLLIPYGPVVEIISLYDTEDPPVLIDPDKYHVSGLDFKTLHANPINGAEFFYNINGSVDIWNITNLSCAMNLTYNAGYGTDTGYTALPKSLNNAILVQVNEDYKNLGNPSIQELSSVAKKMAQPFSRNLVLQ